MAPIAVLSDIHGNLPALEAVAADLERRGIQRVFNLGDHLSGPLWPLETLRFLQGTEWIHLRGNHDRQLVEGKPEDFGASDAYAFQFLNDQDLIWLGQLPSYLVHEEQFGLFHGRPKADDCYLLDTIRGGRIQPASRDEILDRLGGVKTPLVLCGHSHTPRVVYLPGGRLALNPGSVGLQAYIDQEPQPHKIEVGSPHARYAILDREKQEWKGEEVRVEYDYQLAAKQARLNGRPVWARALLTGTVQRTGNCKQ